MVVVVLGYVMFDVSSCKKRQKGVRQKWVFDKKSCGDRRSRASMASDCSLITSWGRKLAGLHYWSLSMKKMLL